MWSVSLWIPIIGRSQPCGQKTWSLPPALRMQKTVHVLFMDLAPQTMSYEAALVGLTVPQCKIQMELQFMPKIHLWYKIVQLHQSWGSSRITECSVTSSFNRECETYPREPLAQVSWQILQSMDPLYSFPGEMEAHLYDFAIFSIYVGTNLLLLLSKLLF